MIQNPTGADYRSLEKEVREKARHMPLSWLPEGASTTRSLEDSRGNRWIWQVHQATHGRIEPGLSKLVGEKVKANKE